MGNTYDQAFGGAIPNTENWQDFKLDGEYSTISGTVFLNYRNRNDYGSAVRLSIYCLDSNGNEIRQHYDSGIIETGVMPKYFEYDISDAQYIRIIIYGDEYLRLADCMLTRLQSKTDAMPTSSVSNTLPLSPIVQVITSGDYTIGLRADGRVLYAGKDGPEKAVTQWENISQIWYDSDFGVVGISKDGKCIAPNTELEDLAGIVSLTYSKYDKRLFGLRNDGTVHLLSKLKEGEVLKNRDFETWTNVSSIVANGIDGLNAITKDGNVLGPLSKYITSEIQTLFDNPSGYAALTKDGRVLTNDVALRHQTSSWGNMIKIDCIGDIGEWRLAGQLEDGSIEIYFTLGEDISSALMIPSTRDVVDFYLFHGSLICRTAQGRVFASIWSPYLVGQEYLKKLTEWENVEQLSLGYKDEWKNEHFVIVGLKADGSVVATGSNEYGQCNVGTWYPSNQTNANNVHFGSADVYPIEPISLSVLSLSAFVGNPSEYRNVTFSTATASSVLHEGDITFVPEYAISKDTTRPWVEGVTGDGIGEYLKLNFDDERMIDVLVLRLGYGVRYEKNNRPKLIEFEFSDGSTVQYEFPDYNGLQAVTLSETVKTSFVKMTILSVYPGAECQDTCITEVSAYAK